MKGRLLAISSILWLSSTALFAQQDKLLTHFMYDKMTINPGSTGINDGFCATSIYRNQWDKVNGAPNSALLNLEGNIHRWYNGGVGLSFFHDAIGFTRQNNLYLNFSQHVALPFGVLGVGVGLGFQNQGMNPNWVPPTSAVDPTLPQSWSALGFDMNAGIYLKGYDGWYAGISSTHLPAGTLAPKGQNVTENFEIARHYYLMGGYKYTLPSGDHIEGNALMRTDAVKFSGDINGRYIWQNSVYGGLGYRVSDAVNLMAGADLMKLLQGPRNEPDVFLIGYSYDISVNKLSNISRGSHEILMKYCYYLPPIPIQKSKHPRWL